MIPDQMRGLVLDELAPCDETFLRRLIQRMREHQQERQDKRMVIVSFPQRRESLWSRE